jgi:predicted O-methyltransferase YrrM
LEEVPADDSASRGERMLLYWFIRELRPKVVVETGSHKGLSTLYMAAALHDNKEGHITTADTNPQWNSRGNFAKFPDLLPYITFHMIEGKQLAVDNIDFLFLDSFHDKQVVLDEISALFPRLSTVATVVFHDCWHGTSDGVNEAIAQKKLRTIWLPTKNAIRIYSKHPPKMTGPLA